MGLFDSLFRDAAAQEKEVAELWRKLRDMPKQQLLDIVKLRPNTTHGKLALVLLFKVDGGEAAALIRKSDDDWHANLLKGLMRSDVILLGKGNEFDEIRLLLKQALRVVDPQGDW